jgi:tetratricopeptide (TPR) repeat protein
MARHCLAAEPWERPRDAGAVAAALTAYQESVAERLRQAELARAAEAARAEEAKATAAQERRAREAAQARAAAERRARRLTLGLAASVLLTVLVGGGGWLWVAKDRAEHRRQEQARQAQAAAEVQAALEKAAGLREKARAAALTDMESWAEARAVALRAEALLENDPVDPELVARVRALLGELDDEANDRRLLVRLDALRLAQAADSVWMSGFAEPRALQDYARAFAERGLDPLAGPAEEAAQQVRRRPDSVRELLVEALEEWLDLARYHKAPKADRLARVVDAIDPDPWRQQLRRVVARADPDALDRLARAEEFGRQRPQTVLRLARHLNRKFPQRTVELLWTARQRFPSDFWVNFKLSQVLMLSDDPKWNAEAKRFATAAVALRPDNPQAWLLLGTQLRGRDERLAACRKAVELAPRLAGAHTALGNAWRERGQTAAAAAAFREAIALQPLPWAHESLGLLLAEDGQTHDAAIAEFRRAAAAEGEITVGEAPASLNLITALAEKGRFHEAAASSRKAVAVAHAGRARAAGNCLLLTTDRADEAVALCRKAVAADPEDAVAHLGLAWGLRFRGQLEQSLAAFRLSQELMGKRGSFLNGAPVARWVREAERLREIDRRWPDYVAGKQKPRDRDERRLLTFECVIRKCYLAAVRMHADGLAGDPAWADDPDAEARYDAARFAALVAAGRGTDAAGLDANERGRWRRQAMDWLQAERVRQAQYLESGSSLDRRVVLIRLRWWQQEPDLAAVRDPAAVTDLPAAERAACQKLWSEVAALVGKARQGE